MQILKNTLAFIQTSPMMVLNGDLHALNDGNVLELLSFDLPMPGLTFGSIAGNTSLSISAVGNLSLQPEGNFLFAIVVPEPSDLTGDGVVDGADIGAVLAAWTDSGAQLGQVVADQGKKQQVVGYVSGAWEGSSSIAMTLYPPILCVPLPKPTDCVLQVRMVVSPGATVKFGPAIGFA